MNLRRYFELLNMLRYVHFAMISLKVYGGQEVEIGSLNVFGPISSQRVALLGVASLKEVWSCWRLDDTYFNPDLNVRG